MAQILLAEDDESLRKFLAAALVRAGHDVTDFGDGEEAFECLKCSRFDLLRTDIVMPGMNGVELVAELTKTRPSLQAVFMSGYPDYSGPRLPNGSTFLQKPFSPEELAQRIQAVLS